MERARTFRILRGGEKAGCMNYARTRVGGQAEKQNPRGCPRGFWQKPAMTYFRVIHTIMGPKCLTAVFGMGTGVATWVWSPARRFGPFSFSARRILGAGWPRFRDTAGAKRRSGRNIKKAADQVTSLYATPCHHAGICIGLAMMVERRLLAPRPSLLAP